MARATIKIAFLTDENVPDSLGRWLRWRGHSVALARDTMLGEPDVVIAAAAVAAAHVLVSWDGDFNDQRIAARFPTLSRIAFSIPEADGLNRLKQDMALIEFAWSQKISLGYDRMVIRIGKTGTKLDR